MAVVYITPNENFFIANEGLSDKEYDEISAEVDAEQEKENEVSSVK